MTYPRVNIFTLSVQIGRKAVQLLPEHRNHAPPNDEGVARGTKGLEEGKRKAVEVCARGLRAANLRCGDGVARCGTDGRYPCYSAFGVPANYYLCYFYFQTSDISAMEKLLTQEFPARG
jgi:hypothetical protein